MVDVLIKSLVLIGEMVLKVVLTLIINTFTISELTISKARLLNCTLGNRSRNYKSHVKANRYGKVFLSMSERFVPIDWRLIFKKELWHSYWANGFCTFSRDWTCLRKDVVKVPSDPKVFCDGDNYKRKESGVFWHCPISFGPPGVFTGKSDSYLISTF